LLPKYFNVQRQRSRVTRCSYTCVILDPARPDPHECSQVCRSMSSRPDFGIRSHPAFRAGM
jgi:hypothetical protein